MRKIDHTYLPIPPNELSSLANKGVHVEGHNVSAIYTLRAVSGNTATLYNRSSKTTLNVPTHRLRYTRKNQPE